MSFIISVIYTLKGIKSPLKKDPSPKTQISRTKIGSKTSLGIWSLEFGI